VERAFRVFVQEAPERGEEDRRVPVFASLAGGAEVVHQHLADLGRTPLTVEQLAGDRRRFDLGHMLVLHDRSDLVGVEPAHGDAVFDGNHLCGLPVGAPTRLQVELVGRE
jgi:hypothetical protein